MNNKSITLKSFIWQNKVTDIAPEHCFDVALAKFEQMINTDFRQLDAEGLNSIHYYYRESNKFRVIFV